MVNKFYDDTIYGDKYYIVRFYGDTFYGDSMIVIFL